MKTFQILAILSFTAAAAAQSLPPAPTESVGCEPHGDHWHCEGPAEDAGDDEETPSSTEEASATPSADEEDEDDHDHDHDHDEASSAVDSVSSSLDPDLPPEPTQSIGCEPHGDHWHCEGPADEEASEDGEDGEDDDSEAGAAGFASVGAGAAAIAALLAL